LLQLEVGRRDLTLREATGRDWSSFPQIGPNDRVRHEDLLKFSRFEHLWELGSVKVVARPQDARLPKDCSGELDDDLRAARQDRIGLQQEARCRNIMHDQVGRVCGCIEAHCAEAHAKSLAAPTLIALLVQKNCWYCHGHPAALDFEISREAIVPA
jgi:hypothetical protein